MTPQQQFDYLTGQLADLNAAMVSGNARQDPEVARQVAKANAPQALRLLGYMTALEHAGVLPRALADELAPALEAMAAAI
ncbi:hypothetical protein ACR3H8_20215 [Pseudomonas aeruginosa]|uniref:hypothetical protein n=1 Tax=Pseudomonas aeruginosa TaxID=287 RepID=UPI000E32834B|nr:hypothetical protein [Pseudomonas aeruginosa]MCC0301121.1 hypothetical protein [Pseudomonas aeruginosa]MCC0408520.1 hypothetical protein [Pseudomonas aeruginosa]MCC0433662.1 hypothetical protein [Pseudomonas aeruginosa]MCT5450502.1 hypothetical protein [Pseudomonas aeruginosa]NQC65605.1 hypothetical protein [Pseudomonas aeruginosa]